MTFRILHPRLAKLNYAGSGPSNPHSCLTSRQRSHHEGMTQDVSAQPLSWLAVKKLKSSYHNTETPVFIVYTFNGNLKEVP